MTLEEFQAESNLIEGIVGVRAGEVEALQRLLGVGGIDATDLEAYVRVIQPDAELRWYDHVPGVRVGRHVAPPSGEAVRRRLTRLLGEVNDRVVWPGTAYCVYQNLHPFTDGNGRSGRALWLWMHRGLAPGGFLRAFHYEMLEAADRLMAASVDLVEARTYHA